MKTLAFTLLAIITLSFSKSETTVYFCNNGATKVYHLTKSCRGMKRCEHEIKAVRKSDAVNTYELRLCGYED